MNIYVNEPDTLNDASDPADQFEGIGDDHEPTVPACWIGSIVLSFVLLGTFLFPFWEPWTTFEAFYFCFVTITTIG